MRWDGCAGARVLCLLMFSGQKEKFRVCWLGREHEERGFCREQKGEDVLWAGWRALHLVGSVLLSILVISELLRNLGQLC